MDAEVRWTWTVCRNSYVVTHTETINFVKVSTKTRGGGQKSQKNVHVVYGWPLLGYGAAAEVAAAGLYFLRLLLKLGMRSLYDWKASLY